MYDFLVDNKTIYNYELLFMSFFSVLTKIVIFLFIVGFFSQKPELFERINFGVKIMYATFLIYRFNTFRTQINVTELDRRVALSSGIYILLISFIDLFNSDIEKIRGFIIPYTKPILRPFISALSPTA